MNKKVDKGSPCQRPQEGQNLIDGVPLIRRDKIQKTNISYSKYRTLMGYPRDEEFC